MKKVTRLPRSFVGTRVYRFDFKVGRKLTHREWKDVWA